MEDVAPKLLEDIQKDFKRMFDESSTIKKIYEELELKKATYKEANEFAIEVGEILTKAFQQNISSDILPDGKLYYNIAERILTPPLEQNYEIVSAFSKDVQSILNEKIGISIKPVKPEINRDRIQGIINIVSGKSNYDDIAYMLGDPIVNFTLSVVDAVVRINADFQYKAGLNPKIRRTSTGKCCEWCDKLVGLHNYEEVSDTGNKVFRRHKNCKCLVEYDIGNGKRQNVHTKKWRKQSESDTIKETPKEKEKRIKEEKGLDFASKISEHPKMLRAYTPNGLYNSLKNSGYEIKPLKGKNYKDIPFEEGGGFRVHFGGDGILMYHPGERSHHGGEYYKISTGKGGTKRYDREGNEIEKDR